MVERAAATGMAAYMEALALTERETYDAQGNCFHPLALAVRIMGPIKQWRAGEALPQTAIPGPAQQLRRVAAIRTAVKEELQAPGVPRG
eukprot:12449511-Alexandrium_andersonii.AAC.1